MIITIHLLLRSNVCNDLAEAMKALEGKKMTKILLEKQSHPLIAQMIKPAGSSDPPPSNSAASSTSNHEHPSASMYLVRVNHARPVMQVLGIPVGLSSVAPLP